MDFTNLTNEELLKKLEGAKTDRFYVDMIDHWSAADSARWSELTDKIHSIEAELKARNVEY